MPVVSVCPYCNRGRVRADDDAIGTTAKCPSCGSEFTFIPSDEEAVVAAGARTPSSSSNSVPSVYAEEAPPRRPVAARTSPPTQPLASETLPDATPAVPAKPQRPIGDPDELPDPARLPGLIAAAVAVVGVVAWMIPDFGRLVWLGLAVVAGGVAGWSFLAADRNKLFAIIGAGAAGGSLLLCLVLPSLFGEGWLPDRGFNSNEVVAIGADGELTDGRKVLDATKAEWMRDGVRVRVIAVRRGTVEVTVPPAGPKKQPTRKSVPDVLQVVVEVANDGSPRPVPFAGWTESAPAVFRTAEDAEIGVKRFDGTTPEGPPPRPQTLHTGLSARQTLYFDLPPEGAGGRGKLELPVAALGMSGDPVRFFVPFQPFNRNNTKPGGGK